MIVRVLGAFIAIFTFAVLQETPKKYLGCAGIVGAVGWLAYLLSEHAGADTVLATFISAMTITLISHTFARIFKAPVTVFLIAGILNGTITISLTGEPGWQTICVSDTGTGMSEEMRKNALRGYVSADKDYWRHGIGLYVCHQIITAHGGKIWLKSKEGEGTQVFFSLPEEES